MKNLRNTKINDPKNKQNIPRRNKYILEILSNIFKFYILKYIIKFLQSRDNNKKKKQFGFHNFAEHRLRTSAVHTCTPTWRNDRISRHAVNDNSNNRISMQSSKYRANGARADVRVAVIHRYVLHR